MSKAELENHLFGRISAALRLVPAAQAQDAYALYLVLSLDEAGGYWPCVSSLAWLTQADVSDEKARSFGSRWSGWAASGESVLSLCDQERDAEGFALQIRFYESLLSDESARQRWAAFRFAWPFRWDEVAMSAQDQASFTTMLDALRISAEDRRFLSSTTLALLPLDLSQALFPVLAAVIRRLHAGGSIRECCGRDVPLGVMATNDVGYQFGLEPTREGNPERLAQGMEEWMMGEPYSALEAREVLEREIQTRTPEEQARYWAQAALEVEEFLWNDKRSPLTEDLQQRGLIGREEGRHTQHLHLSQRLQDLVPQAIPHLVALAEARAANTYPTYGQHKTPADHAEHLLSLVEALGSRPAREQVAYVPEATIERLQSLMHRLWPEYKEMRQSQQRPGFCLQYIARGLHALRPDRFPAWRQNPRDASEFNFADFGLL